MWLEAVLSKEDLAALIAQFVPLTIHMNPDAGGDQYIELATATHFALVADQGLRMTTRARVHWPILGIAVPITVDPLSVMIRPQITHTARGDALSFTLEIEQADFAGIPAFGDQAITQKVNRELSSRHAELAWAFSSMLSHRFHLPPLLEPLDSLALNVAWGKVRVTDEAMVLAISFHAQVSRRDDDVVSGQPTDGSAVDQPERRGLANHPWARGTPNLTQVAHIGGATLAVVGAFFTLRGAAKWLRNGFR
jgi:hypothetical protein